MAKKSDSVVVEAQERDGSVSELEAYNHYRLTGANEHGYIEPTRDQETDIAPEKGVAPQADMFNPPPPETVNNDIARPASAISARVDTSAAAPLSEKEEKSDEFFESEVTPQDFAGGDEDGNLPENDNEGAGPDAGVDNKGAQSSDSDKS